MTSKTMEKYVMTSRSRAVKKYVIDSKGMSLISKSTESGHDINKYVKTYVLTSKVRHDVKKYVMTSERMESIHDFQTYVLAQKVCHN